MSGVSYRLCYENNKRQREALSSKLVQEATLDKVNRPSIETLLHSFLYKYTLHMHPIVVNMIVIQKNYKEILKTIFHDFEIVFVDYKTPGIELALELNKELNNYNEIPKIIFLQNHGLIVSSEHKQDIKNLTEFVLQRIETYLNIDMKRYKLTTDITYLLNSFEKNSNISYLSEDSFLNNHLEKNRDLFFNTPFCPDSLVYCGVSCCEIEELFDIENLKKYKDKYFEIPKVLVFENRLFFIASNIKKAKEMEEVMKFHIMVLEQSVKNDKNFLELEELAYLSNWEAEKYRQNK